MTKKQKFRFQDLEKGFKYRFLEEGADSAELQAIAAKRGIVLPSPDVSILKAEFAYADEFNRNGCRLPSEELGKDVLQTLVGKNIDIDHERKRNCGHWVDATLEGTTMVAYGCFWKSAFDKEFASFKEKLENGEAGISFEAWIDREDVDGERYDARNIHFCGGALLDKTEPAFATARVLEFSSVIGEKIIENSSYQCECIECGKTLATDKHCKDVKCSECGGQMRRKERPGTGQPKQKLETKGGVEMDFEKILAAIENATLDEIDEKLKEFATTEEEIAQIKDNEEVKKVIAIAQKAKEEKDVEDAKIAEEAKAEETKKAELAERAKKVELPESASEEEIVAKEQELEDAKKTPKGKWVNEVTRSENVVSISYSDGDEVGKEEYSLKEVRIYTQSDIEAKDAEISELKGTLEEATKKLDAFEVIEEAKRVEETKKVEKAKIAEIADRKEKLGEFAKDMSDEDIMDELKYENATLKKQIADIAANPEKASDIALELETGAKGTPKTDLEKTWDKAELVNKAVENLK